MKTWAIVLCVLAAPVSAQELTFSPEATQACLDAQDFHDDMSRADCAGASSNICMDTPGGSSTVGMGYCLSQELDLWDARLNETYRALLTVERALDAETATLGASVPPRASALRDMQRAWIGFRDATCVYEYAQWGGGTGGGPANTSCLLRLTALQALELERRLRDHDR